MALEQYLRPPRCRQCGKKDTLRVDKWANSRPWRKYKCQCAGYWFPHRRGSKFCWYRKNGEQRMPEDPDFADRHFDEEKEAA